MFLRARQMLPGIGQRSLDLAQGRAGITTLERLSDPFLCPVQRHTDRFVAHYRPVEYLP